MTRQTHVAFMAGAVAMVLLASACRDSLTPRGFDPPTFGVGGNGDEGKKDKGEVANFRLTGGGRVDKPEPETGKNTPDSRDFATFGFQARPTGSNTTEGSGHITWVEHNPAAVGGGFTFQGTVTFFTRTSDETAGDDDCGRFGGTGRAHTRDGQVFEGVDFTVEHACDKGEPGRNDHIRIVIAGGSYERHGLLSGGNIQKHRLTGNQ